MQAKVTLGTSMDLTAMKETVSSKNMTVTIKPANTAAGMNDFAVKATSGSFAKLSAGLMMTTNCTYQVRNGVRV
jgi:hypothetical protein